MSLRKVGSVCQTTRGRRTVIFIDHYDSRSRWLGGLGRGSVADCLLRLRVQIPEGAWMFILNVVCCTR
jgi:hypothetical protein